ncbi:hypothetical protein OMR58_25545 [Erwinia sp. INIA-01]|uniref:alginate O-acetyltransferase AlgX-related protein n=1 Tax=Erwinia sp. INIA01 TaxID=2991500 RepID=UPI0022257455|nr:hypothetical protein [Erwinia sp. INIA01]MCW1877808.1 hypothetical protein [Erwinia sp. INIA01]
MKKYIKSFIIASILGLLVVPAINVYNGIGGTNPLQKNGFAWLKNSNFFNMDFSLPYLGFALYKNGISISPENVVVGKDGWLFLGDRHAYVMSESRNLKPFNKMRMDKFAEARLKWDSFVKSQGGIGYFVSVAPNSHSIYREKMPDWASKAKPSANIEYLLSKSDNDKTLADLGSSIRLNKNSSHLPLYFKTDTHWNSLGAWYGYQDLQKKLSHSDPSLKWLGPEDIKFSYNERSGGDLSRFLRITQFVKDTAVSVEINRNSKIHITDFKGNNIRSSDLSDRQDNMEKQLIVYSSNALNNKKVLWLRDSFGGALYPYMNATFSTIMQQHYQDVLSDPKHLRKMIQEFNPDLVIITTVERNALSGYFGNFPN